MWKHRFAPAERAAARWVIAARDGSSVDCAPDGITLEEVVAAGCRHGLAGLLLDALDRSSLDLPQPLCRSLQDKAQRITTTNLNGYAAFVPIARKLIAAGLPFLVLKGAHLNRTIYTQPHHRLMTDIDILLHPDDADRADRLLKQIGCTPGKPLVREDFYPRFYYEREYHTPGPLRFRLDVHVRPFRPLRYAATVPETALWQDADDLDLDGAIVSVPSPENTLIHLAVHSAIHGDARLLWLYDIHRLVAEFGSRLDAAKVCHRLRAWKLNHPAKRTLATAADLFGDQALRALADRIDSSCNWADRLVCFQSPRDNRHRIAGVLANFVTTPDRHLKWGYLGAVLQPERSQMAKLYPYRHPGWLWAAHLRRALRTISRPLTRR